MRPRLKLQELRFIIFRNVFLFTNGIIGVVVVLLFVFGDWRAGLFLGIVSVVNIGLGLFQDIRAWIALQNLQLLTAPRAVRIRDDGSEELLLTEEVRKNDRIKLKVGDQVPCDSTLLEAQSMEINEGLITGESNSLSRARGDRLLAGSIVTSGSGVIRTETIFRESRIARMTEGIKKYSVSISPMQESISRVILSATYVLVAVLIFVVIRGILVHEPSIRIVKNIGALTSMIMPTGLLFAATLFFAYGAAHLFRRQVLLQEVNATEKLGRIRNLCMDKTGTLTDTVLTVEDVCVPPAGNAECAKEYAAAYMKGTGDVSQTMRAVKIFIARDYTGEIIDMLAFSSRRQFGAVRAKDSQGDTAVLVGAPDVFLPHVSEGAEKQWLESFLEGHAREGKRIVCVAYVRGTVLPHDLSAVSLAIAGVFVFRKNLREGISRTVDFFQERGVRIRIISGDHPDTVRVVAALAGVRDTDKLITGSELESWSAADFLERVKSYAIFARIKPEQKEKIIEAFQEDGFTAMVGDGANDALAIKKADLGIAMFDGAPATRQLASVVLMNNSFAALPGGVELADSIIRNLEIFASIFLNLSLAGFFLFVIVSILGYEYPLTPLNVTLINYFTIGLPGILISYWAIRPWGKVRPASTKPFLGRILPFVASSAVVQALGAGAVFALSPAYLKTAESNTLVILASIVFGFIFFVCTPRVYRGITTGMQKMQFLVLGILELLLGWFVLKTPFLTDFFSVTPVYLSSRNVLELCSVFFVIISAEYLLARWFVSCRSI
ncbi:MAG: HAD-IC family P-type ATPase [Candidatus Sungbacteria bacterium]|nr:HAD-IC family P-type ATPase [Candidatus Sungbacteria bacterium]